LLVDPRQRPQAGSTTRPIATQEGGHLAGDRCDLAAQDDPPAALRPVFALVVASVLIVGFYLFAVMPRVTTSSS
jgi:hypothetical protein